ncbi:MAG: hypothetical protein M0C28_40635 [Candidatus Moduliflexus flocculans]|nr:hypothetical protein [Candidatus Moduliflexus flocculans]
MSPPDNPNPRSASASAGVPAVPKAPRRRGPLQGPRRTAPRRRLPDDPRRPLRRGQRRPGPHARLPQAPGPLRLQRQGLLRPRARTGTRHLAKLTSQDRRPSRSSSCAGPTAAGSGPATTAGPSRARTAAIAHYDGILVDITEMEDGRAEAQAQANPQAPADQRRSWRTCRPRTI